LNVDASEAIIIISSHWQSFHKQITLSQMVFCKKNLIKFWIDVKTNYDQCNAILPANVRHFMQHRPFKKDDNANFNIRTLVYSFDQGVWSYLGNIINAELSKLGIESKAINTFDLKEKYLDKKVSMNPIGNSGKEPTTGFNEIFSESGWRKYISALLRAVAFHQNLLT
jgi:hypothetical protein